MALQFQPDYIWGLLPDYMGGQPVGEPSLEDYLAKRPGTLGGLYRPNQAVNPQALTLADLVRYYSRPPR